MATITKPMALDESFNTTEVNSRNQADVLVGIENAIREGFGQVASGIEYDNTESSITATNVQDAIDEVDGIVDGIESDIQGTQSVSGNPLTVTDAAPIYAEEVDVAVECTQTGSGTPSPSNIRPIQGYDIVSVDRCGKNLLPVTLASTSNNGITYSIDSDGIITASGTLTGEFSTVRIYQEEANNIPTGDYILNGCPSGYGQNLYLNIWDSATDVKDYGSGVSKNLVNGRRFYVAIVIRQSLSTPVKFKPMLRLSTETDATFAPFDSQTVSLQLGNKNLLPMTVEGIKAANTSRTWSGNVCVVNGVTYTILTDANGNVTGIDVNGTGGSGNSYFKICSTSQLTLKAGKYKLNGCPSGGSTSSYILYNNTSGWIDNGSSADGAELSLNSDTVEEIFIRVNNGTTLSHKVFYPMIRDANVSDPTFSPYNPTLGGMVYGGQLTLKDDGSAVFVGDKGSTNFGSLNWYTYNADARIYYSDELPSVNSNFMCSGYKPVIVSTVNQLNNGEVMLSGNKRIYVKDTSQSSASNFKSSVIGIIGVYELATPFTIHLSAEQLKLLQGTNNVWSNAGNVTLKYQPDNVIAEPKADVQRLRDDVDDRLVGNACRNLFPQTNVTIANNARVTVVTLPLPLPIGTYTLSAIVESTDTDSNQCVIIGYNVNGEVIINQNINRSKNRTSITFTINAKLQILAFYASTTYSGGLNDSAVFKDVQLERGSSPTAYEEYYPSNRELANLVDSSLVKCNPTTDYADRSHYIDISAYDDNKPIFGYVYLAKGAYIRYCPVWLMKDWGTDEPSNTIITAHVTSYFKFTFYYNNSPRRVMLAEVKDYNDDDVSGYNAIRLYLYRNY